MKKYKYIIIGGGMAGSSALMGIRKHDPDGTIALFSEETFPPYNRPPLSKGLWGKMKIDVIMRPIKQFNADIFLQNRIVNLDVKEKVVRSENKDEYGYAKLLLATGGHPMRLPGIPKEVLSFRTLDDFKRLRAISESKERICVIGGGFIGSEIAAVLNKAGNKVTLIFPETGISSRFFPDDLSNFLNQYYRTKGVNVLPGKLVKEISRKNGVFTAKVESIDTNAMSTLDFDAVVLGIGIKPNVKLAQDAGLSVDNGIVVNKFLQTNDPEIYSAGDVANFFNVGLGKRTRAEHEDNANQMGMTAGENMAGSHIPYTHLPFFYSDLFDLGYEAVGEFNKEHQIFEDWIEPYEKGTLFYMEGDIVRGLVFWNLWGKIDQGRQLIANGKSHTRAALKGLFT